jgi:hypothetical protein
MSNQICRKGNNSYIVSLNILYGRMQPVKVVSDCPFGIFKLSSFRSLTLPHVRGGVQSDLKSNGKIIVSLCVINNAFNAISAKMQANGFILVCE